MFIEQPSIWLRWLYPHALWRMDKRERAVSLTFDDGPIPESTPFILETLARYNALATFFMVGQNVERHPHLYRQILDAGHRVGNHTYNHMGGARHTIRTYSDNARQADDRARILASQAHGGPSDGGHAAPGGALAPWGLPGAARALFLIHLTNKV